MTEETTVVVFAPHVERLTLVFFAFDNVWDDRQRKLCTRGRGGRYAKSTHVGVTVQANWSKLGRYRTPPFKKMGSGASERAQTSFPLSSILYGRDFFETPNFSLIKTRNGRPVL